MKPESIELEIKIQKKRHEPKQQQQSKNGEREEKKPNRTWLFFLSQ